MLEVYRSFPSPVFPVSVTIAIPVSISVTVATAVRAHPVEDNCHVAELVIAVKLLHVGQQAAVQAAGAHHEDGEVADAVGDSGVRHDAHGDIVHDDVVVALAQFLHHRVKPFVHEQLRRVGCHRTR